MAEYLIPLVVLMLFAYLGMSGWRNETINFNHGICKDCGNPLEHFDNDSQGGRGYTCRSCDHTVWVSYPNVDRLYRQKVRL